VVKDIEKKIKELEERLRKLEEERARERESITAAVKVVFPDAEILDVGANFVEFFVNFEEAVAHVQLIVPTGPGKNYIVYIDVLTYDGKKIGEETLVFPFGFVNMFDIAKKIRELVKYVTRKGS